MTIKEEKETKDTLYIFFSAQLTIEGVVVQKADCCPTQPSADYLLLKK